MTHRMDDDCGNRGSPRQAFYSNLRHALFQDFNRCGRALLGRGNLATKSLDILKMLGNGVELRKFKRATKCRDPALGGLVCVVLHQVKHRAKLGDDWTL